MTSSMGSATPSQQENMASIGSVTTQMSSMGSVTTQMGSMGSVTTQMGSMGSVTPPQLSSMGSVTTQMGSMGQATTIKMSSMGQVTSPSQQSSIGSMTPQMGSASFQKANGGQSRAVVDQSSGPRRFREIEEVKMFKFSVDSESAMKMLEEIRQRSTKQFDYIMDVGNQISELCKNEQIDELKELIDQHVDILPLLRMHIEEAFDCVLQLRFEEMLEYFLDNGFDLTEKNDDCLIQLCITCKFFSDDPPLSTLKLLLRYGADVNAIEKIKFRSPLHYAAKYGMLSFINELIEQGAEIDPIDSKKRTPLNYALKRKNEGGHFKDIIAVLNSNGGTKKWNKYVKDNNVY